MSGYRVMVRQTPTGEPVCIISYHPAGQRKTFMWAVRMSETLTQIGIPAWVEWDKP